MVMASDAARMLGITRQAVWYAMRAGKLTARKSGYSRLIAVAEVERYRRTMRHPKKEIATKGEG